MVLVFSDRNGPAGGLVELDSPTGNILSPVVELFSAANPAFGQQAQWAIDPILGSDTSAGTLAAPLRTMRELNDRLSNQRFSVAATLQLVGDVSDESLMLTATRFTGSGSLTVLGTVSAVASGTITLVTTLQSNCTFQLTTTGIVWVLANVGSRLLLATGHTCWIQEFVDPNNVIVGPVTNTTTAVTPTAVAFDLQTLSAALPPQIMSASDGSGVARVLFQNLSFSGGSAQNAGGAAVSFYGCRFVGGLLAKSNIALRGCLHQLAGLTQGGLGGSGLTFSAHTFIGSIFQAAANVTFAITSWATTVLTTAAGTTVANAGAMHFRNAGAAACITLSQGGRFTNQNFAVSGSVGNTGFGINVRAGCGFTYLIAGTKPTVTGAAGDTKIGVTTVPYVNVPYTDLLLDAVPPTVRQLTGTPAFMALEN